MAETLKDKVEDAGHQVAETATRVGHKVSEKVEEASDWAKEKAHQAGNRIAEATEKAEHKLGMGQSCGSATPCCASDIKEHMQVVASCGTSVGKVDHVEGDTIKLTKNDSVDGEHHRIPLSWVTQVDHRVHLDRDHLQVQSQWRPG